MKCKKFGNCFFHVIPYYQVLRYLMILVAGSYFTSCERHLRMHYSNWCPLFAQRLGNSPPSCHLGCCLVTTLTLFNELKPDLMLALFHVFPTQSNDREWELVSVQSVSTAEWYLKLVYYILLTKGQTVTYIHIPIYIGMHV